jgi:hypothetical protein
MRSLALRAELCGNVLPSEYDVGVVTFSHCLTVMSKFVIMSSCFSHILCYNFVIYE